MVGLVVLCNRSKQSRTEEVIFPNGLLLCAMSSSGLERRGNI